MLAWVTVERRSKAESRDPLSSQGDHKAVATCGCTSLVCRTVEGAIFVESCVVPAVLVPECCFPSPPNKVSEKSESNVLVSPRFSRKLSPVLCSFQHVVRVASRLHITVAAAHPAWSRRHRSRGGGNNFLVMAKTGSIAARRHFAHNNNLEMDIGHRSRT